MTQASAASLREMLERHHLRVTEPRLAVLKSLMGRKGSMTAYEIIDQISQPGKPVNPPTVYRALQSLTEAGIAHRIESLNAYVFCNHHAADSCCHKAGQEVFFAICDDCGKVEEIEQNLKPAIGTILESRGFHVAKRVLEIHGQCNQCYKN